jgi:hypothetical protein
MAFPKLVRNPKIPVRVIIAQEEPNEFGERQIILDKSFRCNYQDSGTTKYAAEKQRPEATGVIYIDGDILASPGIAASDFPITPEGVLVLTGSLADESGALDYAELGAADDLIASGHVIIFGQKREIVKGTKARNLDGSVNYTRLDVR